MAYFGPSGRLSGSGSLLLDSEGRVQLPELHAALHMHGNTVSNVTLTHVASADIDRLRILSATTGGLKQGGILFLDSDNIVSSSNDIISIDETAKRINIPNLNG